MTPPINSAKACALHRKLQRQPQLLRGILRGVEKESLRVDARGQLVKTPHPQALGSALTHPQITTDYSEALLEFITEPHSSVSALFAQLDNIHRYTYSHIGDELLWTTSMPCPLGEDEDIPVAQYGSTNAGRMKTVYRIGLGHRYGRAMQTIAGVHYNFSLPDEFWRWLRAEEGSGEALAEFKTRRYFDLIRNFRRHYWLLLYLFGAAPAVCKSFVKNREHNLQPLGDDQHTLHAPYATSLRMGDLGYQSSAQEDLTVCYNSLENYLQTLCGAITASRAEYEAIGLKDGRGEYRQLNTSLLQIENEFYSAIRPKRTARAGETALGALRRGGVEYIEVRCTDLNPFEPLGIDEAQIRFIDAFLLNCLLDDSPESDVLEYHCIKDNQKRVVYRGREPGLMLATPTGPRSLQSWADELLEQIADSATLLDTVLDKSEHRTSLKLQQAKLRDPELTPSAQLLAAMRASNQSFVQWSLAQAKLHHQHFNGGTLDPVVERDYADMAARSLLEQQALEAIAEVPFEQHLANYYRQYQDCGCKT